MTEILSEINAEVKRFLDSDRDDIYREMSRTAIFNTGGIDIEIRQSKMIKPEELQIIRTEGPAALATTEWFNDVGWIEQLPNDDRSWHQLRLDALYPTEYLDEIPSTASFSGGRWHDQYGGISGFGTREAITSWLLQFVEADGHAVKNLRYPSDPTAIDVYNARYRQYLDQLDAANPTVGYYRGYERYASRDKDKARRVLGGLSLGGIGAYEVVHQGDSAIEDTVDNTSLRFDHRRKRRGYVGRSLDITGDQAITKPYWDGEDDREPASEKLLARTLELVRDTTQR